MLLSSEWFFIWYDSQVYLTKRWTQFKKGGVKNYTNPVKKMNNVEK